MNLVFNEYIGFLKDKGLTNDIIELKEGYYWLDKSIIKAYDKNGKIHKILRIYISDELELTFKKYDDKEFEIESWNETIERNKDRLLELENESLTLIKESIEKYNDRQVVIPTSTGKDSTVTTYLVKKIVDKPRLLFNNVTCDSPQTYKKVKSDSNIEIITPKEGIYPWMKRMNFVPTRFSRSCCNLFKENAMIDYLDENEKCLLFMGMRNSESNTRSGYGDYWSNDKWGKREWSGVLPIRKWTEEDIWLYILMNKIDFNEKYKLGYNRIGCSIICPFYAKSTWVLDKYWYSTMYERWHNILTKDFIDNKKASIMNCTLKEYHIYWNGGAVRDEATEEVIQEFSEQQHLDIDIARKYFNKKCTCCDKNLKKNDIALSMKFYGRQIDKFKCIKCMSNELGTTQKELRQRAEEFKKGGCTLF